MMEIVKPHEIDGIVDALIDGVLVAHNQRGEDSDVICVMCNGGPTMADCPTCAGRGRVDSVPYCDRPWDEVHPNLFVGGHLCQPENGTKGTFGEVWVRDEFDLVVSMVQSDKRFGPYPEIRYIHYGIADDDLDPVHHDKVDELAETVVESLKRGERVLVRCMAGINRSALVAALAMLHLGYTADVAIVAIREARSPYCLFNPSFVDYLRTKEVTMGLVKHGEGEVLPEPGQKKQASAMTEEDKQALAAENEEADSADVVGE